MKPILESNLLAFSFFFVLAGSLHAGNRIWDGGAKNGSFSDSVNWDGDATSPISNTDVLQVGVNTVGGSQFIGFDTGAEFRTPSFTFLPTAATAYTVTAAATLTDILTLTGTGTTLLNQSPVRQNFSLITTTVGAATQTWDGGLTGLVMAQIDLGANHTLTVTGTGTSASTRNEIVGGITGSLSGVTKNGAGVLLFNTSSASDYSGATTITAGSLLLGKANQIPNASKLVLNGGTFDTGGFSDTAGTLLLGGNATIDFGITNLVGLVFADSSSELWTPGTLLNITNYTAGADTLRFGTTAGALTGAQVGQISFNGTPAFLTSSGFLQPIPEPSVSAAMLAGAGVFAFSRRRRDRRATV